VDRHATTVVAVAVAVAVAGAGAGARSALETLRGRANVRVVITDGPEDAWRLAAGTSVPYLVHDADPLAAVADARVRRFDEAGPAGRLEVAVADVVGRWRARSVGLPDHDLVVDPEELPATLRHGYLGFLHAAAPARVVPASETEAALVESLGRLPTGRWWPELDRLLQGVESVVPDRAGVGR